MAVDCECDDDEIFDQSTAAVRKAREFEAMMPARMRGECEVVPIVSDPDEGALSYFRFMAAVINR